ncbi:hypothetical protein UMC2_26211 [[Clostridium] sordellii]|uniref:hypothetical protein n=1 Tax=Paraclostridium sordellii TaxID=1505 RepID=UPI0005434C7C|nr:hypothetical protein [Paeniclostridium sordellii]CEK35728.1 hypothetical protein UMC2_26211 [[Clostridium] sordellii] [Paeniclostridium sordellii]
MKKVMREDFKNKFIESVIEMIIEYDMTIDNVNESIEAIKKYMEQNAVIGK